MRDLREFAETHEITLDRWSFVDLNTELEIALRIFAAHLSEGVTLRRSFAPLPMLECQNAPLQQMFLALLDNAARAVAGLGVIEVATEVVGTELCVSVTDDGCGMTPAVLQRAVVGWWRLALSATYTKSVRGWSLLVGGYSFHIEPELWRDVGADGTAKDAVTAVTLADTLVNHVHRAKGVAAV